MQGIAWLRVYRSPSFSYNRIALALFQKHWTAVIVLKFGGSIQNSGRSVDRKRRLFGEGPCGRMRGRMGLEPHGLNLLRYAGNLGDVVTLGRCSNLLTAGQLRTAGLPEHFAKDRFADSLLLHLGAKSVRVLRQL